MSDELGLPSSIELAWGRRAPSGRGPRPGLSVERIVAAAVSVAEKEGFGAVSMSRVAAEVGSSPMSLYRYVASKDELLVLMMDLPFEAPPEIDPAVGWREALTDWVQAYREVLRRHSWVVRVPISGPPITPNNVAWFEAGLQTLAGTELEEGEKVGTVLLTSSYVRSEAMLAADLEAAEANADLLRILTSYGSLLRELTDAERHPAVRRTLDAGVFDAMDEPPDADFQFGLQTILDGLQTLMTTRAETRS